MLADVNLFANTLRDFPKTDFFMAINFLFV